MTTLLLSILLSTASAQASTLKLTIDGVRSDQGQLLVAIFDDAESFPRVPEKAVVKKVLPAADGRVEIVIDQLKQGSYAVALHHDENGDTKMNFNFVGMPKEGFGFSGNKRIFFGPPSFKNAKFDIAGSETKCDVKMKYF